MKAKGCISNLTALTLILSFALFISLSVFGLPQETEAAVTALDAWTNIHSSAPNNTSGTINTSLTVSSGSNRLFLAAVCLELNTTWSLSTMNVSLGGTALTAIGRTTWATEHCYMGYLQESQIPVGNTLSVQYASTYTVTGIHVKWASYSGVNQTAPINDSNVNTGAATSVTFGGTTPIDYIADGLTLYVAANNGTPATMSAPTDFSQVGSSTTSDGHSSFIAATTNHVSNGNYASSTTVTFGGTTATQSTIVVAALNPLATMVGNGTDPGFVTACPAPNGGATFMDAFTLRTSVGNDTVTGVKVTLSTGLYQRLSKVEITSNDDVDPTVFGHIDTPGSDTVTIPLDTNITVDETETQYRVRITPKSHADIPAGSYTLQGTVIEITSTNPKIYKDLGSGWVTIDNTSPGTPTISGIPGDEQVKLTWTNPFGTSEVVLVKNTSEITGTPVEGEQYSTNPPNNTIGDSTVIYVGLDANPPDPPDLTDTGLTNGTNYYYKIFAKDSCGNYSTGATPPSPYYYTPGPVVAVSSSGTQVTAMNADSTGNYIGAAFTFQQSSGTAGTITALTISEMGDAIAHTELSTVKVYYESGVDLAHCLYDGSPGETLITTTSFDASEKIVLSSVSIPVSLSPNYTCVYVVFDVDQSALNNTEIDLQITSSNDFTFSGSAIKDGSVTYPVALAGTTTIRSTVTNLVKVGSFQSGISDNYTYVTDVGFQPKAVIFFWTRQDSAGVINANESIGMGFATAGPSIVNRSVADACDDNQGTTNCARRRSEWYSIMFLLTPAGTPGANQARSGAGRVTSFDPSGFTITWDENRAVNAYVNYMAIGGDDNFNVKAGTIPATPTSPGPLQVTGVGFKPDFVMFLAGRAENNDTSVAHMFFNVGFMNSTGEQAAISVGGQDGQTTTGHSRSQQRTDNATIGILAAGGQDWLASYSSMDNDGFTLNFTTASAAGPPVFYLALKGGAYKVSSFNQPIWCVPSGAPPCAQPFTADYTTVGFKPVGLFMESVNRSTPTSIAAQGEISIGAASLLTERGTIWGETIDIIPSDTNMSIMTDKVIRLATSSNVDAEADFDSFLSNGFRLNWTKVNDNTARQIVYWAIGNNITTVGNGTNPSGFVTLAPGAGATMLDAFTLYTSSGTDTVTDVTVSLPSGSSIGLSKVEIVDNTDPNPTVYGSVDPNDPEQDKDPDPNKVLIPVTGMPIVTTSSTQYRVRITPKSHAAMPVPPGAEYPLTGSVVTAITSANTKIYSDLTSGSVKIDNLSPGNAWSFSGTPGEGQVKLDWANPSDSDFSQTVLLRNTSAITDTPTEGETYDPINNKTIGTSTVVYIGGGSPYGFQTYTDTGLVGGVSYYYKIFAKDTRGNYSIGLALPPYPSVTASSAGAQVDTMEAGDTDQYIGAAFTFQQSSGTAGNITALTISETGSAVTNTEIKNVKVYYENDVLSCASSAAGTPVSASFNGSEQIVLGSIIPLSVSPKFTCIYVVFDVDLLAVDGHTVDLEITSGTYFTLSSGLIKYLSSYPSSLALPETTTLQDTTPPADVIGLDEKPGDRHITFTWENPSNPSDADFKGVRIMRAEGLTAPSEKCTDGLYIADVAGTPGSAGSYTDNTVANGTTYSYRLCSYDEIPNYSTGVTKTETPPQIPILSYPAAPYDDGKNPDTGDTTTDFTFKVIYTDFENDAPDFVLGFPKIYIGDNDGMFSYTMNPDTSVAQGEPLRDGVYTNGEQYVYGPIGFGAAQDLRFYFEAKAGSGRFTDVTVQLPETGYSTGPSVYLMRYNNMVGVPKDLGLTGLPYSSVLQDDSGAKYCVFWASTGLDTVNGFSGKWTYCISGDSGNIEMGKGYFIWSMAANTYRLDEPDGVGNVTTDDHVDIELAPVGGWTMISNPYNVNIKLEDVKVMREGDSNEYSFSAAVANGWIYNALYEYEGPSTEYNWKAYNDSPPAVLEPWVGYFIYVNDTIDTTLKVYKPVP